MTQVRRTVIDFGRRTAAIVTSVNGELVAVSYRICRVPPDERVWRALERSLSFTAPEAQ